MKYAILLRPNYNIAFFDAYLEMCKIELNVLMDAYELKTENVAITKQSKATYLTFEMVSKLVPEVKESIYKLSFFYALFEVLDGGIHKPVDIDYVPNFEEDLSIRLKYSGKTNEIITRMMLMMAYHLSDYVGTKKPRVLDPLCGRGTTLFEGMISGFDAYGVERDQKAFLDMSTYITRYIKEARIKHTNVRGKVIHDREVLGESYELQYANTKEKYKAKDVNELKVVRCNTTKFRGAFRQNSMHLIVADLPYNVQHSGKEAGPKSEGLSGLLDKGLLEWTLFLKKGGVIALSWNTYTDTRESFIELLTKHGYEVFNESMYKNLKHRVSQAITRDIIFAKKV